MPKAKAHKKQAKDLNHLPKYQKIKTKVWVSKPAHIMTKTQTNRKNLLRPKRYNEGNFRLQQMSPNQK